MTNRHMKFSNINKINNIYLILFYTHKININFIKNIYSITNL